MPVAERALAVGLVLLAAWAVGALLRARVRTVDVLLSVLLAVGSLVWLFGTHAYEGPSVLRLVEGRGLTISDLGVPPHLLLSAAVLLRGWRDHRPRRPES